MDCHALRRKARNDRKWALLLESWLCEKVDSRESCSQRDFSHSTPFSSSKILGFAVLLVVLFVDFRVELDLWSAVALKSTKSLL